MAGSVVLGRDCVVVGSSPNRSILGAGLLAAGGPGRPAVMFFIDADLSSLAFSCTTLSGCELHSQYRNESVLSENGLLIVWLWLKGASEDAYELTTSSSPSPPRVAGSGMGPSITHRFESYLVRIKFSILLCECQYTALLGGRVPTHASAGIWPGASLASQYLQHTHQFLFPLLIVLLTYLFALELPHLSMLWSCSSVQESRSTDLTRLMCVPIPRWIPEHLGT